MVWGDSGLTSVAPVGAVVLWLRWLAAVVVLVWLPGFLLVGRWLGRLDAISRHVLSLDAGLLLVATASALFPLVRAPLTPALFGPLALLLAWAAGRAPAHRRAVAAWGDGLTPLTAAEQLALAVIGALLCWQVHSGFADFTAPPHIHDATNHAFMVLRIAQTGSSDPRVVFAPEIGRPDVFYLMGWQSAAAMAARLSGVAPYISAWFMPLLALVHLPLALTLLWRALGLPAAAALLGALFVLVNEFVPGGILAWGGFGLIVGMFLVPTVALALRAALRERSLPAGALAGLTLAGLLQVHTSQVPVALALGLLATAGRPAPEGSAGGSRWRAPLCALICFAAVAGPTAWGLAGGYVHKIGALPPPRLVSPHDALESLRRCGGQAPRLRLLTLLGAGLALFDRRSRRTALGALAVGVFFFCLACYRDPISRALALPFYGEWARVLYLELFFVPPLLAWPFVRLHELFGRGLPRLLVTALVAAALFHVVGATIQLVPRMFRTFRPLVPFTTEDYALARQVGQLVAPGEVVANFHDDGSAWAMHVAGRRFTLPCAWALRDGAGSRLPDVAADLRFHPWPERTRALAREGVRYLYVSDHRWEAPPEDPLVPATFDADPRFAVVARTLHAALYRILWDAQGDTAR